MFSLITGPDMSTRVLLVDDVEQVRWDLRMILNLSGDLEIVGEAANGLEAMRLTESLRPDVVLIDLEMPVMDGYEAIRLIKTLCPSCRIVVLTIHDYVEARKKAQWSGVDAFLVKGAPIEEIVQTILNKKE
jgi:DNA-binding NarL/FixJ family response regulator